MDAIARMVRHERIQQSFISKECTFEPKINRSDPSQSLSSMHPEYAAKRAKASVEASKRLYKQARELQVKNNEIEKRR